MCFAVTLDKGLGLTPINFLSPNRPHRSASVVFELYQPLFSIIAEQAAMFNKISSDFNGVPPANF